MSKEYNVKNTTELNKILSFGFNSKLTEAVVNDLENMGMFSSADGRLQVYTEAEGYKIISEDERISEIIEMLEKGKDLDSILSKGDLANLSCELIDAREREYNEIMERRLRKKSGSLKNKKKGKKNNMRREKKIDIMKIIMILSVIVNTVCVAVTLWWPTNPAARFYQFFWVMTQTLMILYVVIALKDCDNSTTKKHKK